MIRSFNGKTPKIAESTFISETAYVVGDVEIGDHSSVWPGAVIRSDNSKVRIGKYTRIEDNSVVHGPVDIGDNVIVGHGAVINCRRIGNNVLIGMNATLLHGADIGDFCVIGAVCLVSQGMEIPDNSFVAGVPGTIKGPITSQQRFWVEQAPKRYAALRQQYKKAGL